MIFSSKAKEAPVKKVNLPDEDSEEELTQKKKNAYVRTRTFSLR